MPPLDRYSSISDERFNNGDIGGFQVILKRGNYNEVSDSEYFDTDSSKYSLEE